MHNVSEPGLPVHICTLIKSVGRKVAASVWECNVGIVLPTSAILSLEKRDYIMPYSQLTLCGHREAALQTDSVQRAVKKHTHILNFTAQMCVPEPGPNVVISKRDCVYVCLCFGLMARYSSVSLELLSIDVSELSHNRSNSPKIKEREETRKTKSLLLVHLLDFPASCSLDSMTVHQWPHRCMVILCVLTVYMWAFNFPSDTRWLMMARQGSLKVLLHATPLNVSSSDLALYLKEIPSGNTVSLEISFILCKYGNESK